MKSIIKLIQNNSLVKLEFETMRIRYYFFSEALVSSFRQYSYNNDKNIYFDYMLFYIFKHRKDKIFAFSYLSLINYPCLKKEKYETTI